jgi:hypothetical protein
VPRLIRASAPDAWRAALEGLPFAFGHLPEYVLAAAGVVGGEPLLWSFESPGGARAACPVLRRADGAGSDIATPLGFAGLLASPGFSGDALADAWTRSWAGEGVLAAYVQATPWAAAEAIGGGWDARGGTWSPGPDCLRWDLGPEPDALLSGMSAKHRQLVRKFLREAGPAIADQSVLRDEFVRLYADFCERAGLAPAYRYDAAAIGRISRTPGALFVGATNAAGEVEAITLFLEANGRGDSFLNAATPAGRQHSRGLYWLGALALRARGVRELNLGGGIAGSTALADFKQRLGAATSPTRVLRQVIDRAGFDAACRRAGVQASDGFFPPWRAPARASGESSRIPS